MSSVGQVVGGVVGAVIGFFVGGGPAGAIYGAQIGMTVGGIVDPPDGPQLEGPRLQDKQIIVSTYGNAIPLIYGAENRCSGNVIWSTGLLETSEEEESGGGKGGGGGATTTTYSYRVSFALAMGAGTMVGVNRIWANSKLIYDATGISVPAVDPVNGANRHQGDGHPFSNGRDALLAGLGGADCRPLDSVLCGGHTGLPERLLHRVQGFAACRLRQPVA